MTTGVDIIGSLLLDDATFISLIPADRLKGGRLPDGVQLPAMVLKVVSTVERQNLKRGSTTRTTDRVSATVRAASYDDQRRAMELVRTICAGRTGEIADALRVSVLTAGTGPELDGPGNSFERTQDFRVSYDA